MRIRPGSAGALRRLAPRPEHEEDHDRPCPRTRQQNVSAAQWSPNGGALGAPDLTQPGDQVFGENVFSLAVQRQRLPKTVFQQLQATLDRGRAARPVARRRGRGRDEGLGAGEGRDALHALVPAAHRLDRREARLVLRPDGRRHRDRRVLRQGADPGRARRVLVPDRRHPRHVRGARLHRVGPDVARRSSSRTPTARCCASRRRSRRGRARRSTTRSRCCARWTRCRGRPCARCELLGDDESARVFTTVGPEQEYFLIDEQYYFERPDLVHHRPHAVRRQAAEGPRARRPLLRLDPRARCSRACSRPSASWRSSACRSRRATTRSRRRSTRSRRCSRTRTSAPTTSS